MWKKALRIVELRIVELPIVELPIVELRIVELRIVELRIGELRIGELRIGELKVWITGCRRDCQTTNSSLPVFDNATRSYELIGVWPNMEFLYHRLQYGHFMA